MRCRYDEFSLGCFLVLLLTLNITDGDFSSCFRNERALNNSRQRSLFVEVVAGRDVNK